jgi:membrane-associated phospholipid phosphatase
MARMSTVINDILRYDFIVFQYINSLNLPSFLEGLLILWRNSLFWAPLYLFLVSYAIFNFRAKAKWFILFSLLTVLSSDLVSSRLIKPSVQRLRPCRTEQLDVITRVKCGMAYSFTSSHATNHFALALFWFVTLGYLIDNWKYAILIWAVIIGFCQVYVGVHFPLDIICGSIIGSLIGFSWSMIYEKRYGNNKATEETSTVA